MAKKLLKWRVSPVPTGMYRAFDRRGWPSAFYNDADGFYAACVYAVDGREYCAGLTGEDESKLDGLELVIRFRDYSQGLRNSVDRRLKQTASSLPEAKRRIEAFLTAHPEMRPKNEHT